jgi:hypothetical protein
MKSRVIFRFSTTANIAANACQKAGIHQLINLHHHLKKRKKNELPIFTT